VIVAIGCERTVPTAAIVAPIESTESASASEAGARADTVARGLALSLGDASLRQQLLEDLRDSPFPHHALHLRSYLRGSRGRMLATAAANALHISDEAFGALEAALPELQIVVDRPIDRVRWTGGNDIAVYGTTTPLDTRRKEVRTELGFRPNGDTITIPIAWYASYTYLTLEPVNVRFGADPERVRRAAPHGRGRTISTSLQELSESYRSSAPNYTIVPCEDCTDPGGGGTPDGVLLNSLYTRDYCVTVAGEFTAAEDADADGVRDNCEAALAQAFRPMLAMSSADVTPEMEPYWAVTKEYGSPYGSLIKIFYALSYYHDGGEIRFQTTGHDGDSEFIIVGITGTGGSRWHLDYETLSAHWGAGSFVDETATYGYASVEYPSEYRGRPRVWVSQNKHANYRSKSVCDGMIQDDCDWGFENWTIYRDVDVQTNANLGDVWDHYRGLSPYLGAMRDCFPSRNPAVTGGYTECYWYNYNQDYFAGWRGDQGQEKSTSYAPLLSYYSF